MDRNGVTVSEEAFWHTNMDLYYGYQTGEVVEVEHQFNRFWLATIEYSFKHLVLLRWLGDMGEFWIDTSTQNSATIPGSTLNQSNSPKRIFRLGHHMQSQLRAQYVLSRPDEFLEVPSLYDPKKDPYANVKTVDDLLAYEAESADIDTLVGGTAVDRSEPASIVMAKCKTKIDYGQEDVDELEAALENLTQIEGPNSEINRSPNESPDDFKTQGDIEIAKTEHLKVVPKTSDTNTESVPNVVKDDDSSPAESKANADQINADDEKLRKMAKEYELCKMMQENANHNGKYNGIGEKKDCVFETKPKQIYDLGGANQEKVLVPGTILEVAHVCELESGLKVSHWFAIVLKNVGGRLTLRWFICDSPKFKQGRLELKTNKSEFIQEDTDNDDISDIQTNSSSLLDDKISSKSVTFCMHYCNPCVNTIGALETKFPKRSYKFPQNISAFIDSKIGDDNRNVFQEAQINHILDPRRKNLDKDRPIIDHILSTAERARPSYLDIVPEDEDYSKKNKDVLISCSKLTKLFKGTIKQVVENGVVEVHSEPIPDSNDIIKFVYPYDTDYTILPLDWAANNKDCLSVQPSRDVSPTPHDDTASQEEPEAISEADSGVKVEGSEISTETSMDVKSDTETQNESNDSSNLEKRTNPEANDNLELTPGVKSSMINLNKQSEDIINSKFNVMQQLEVVHPSSDITICVGRIRKIVFPLLWIQISSDSFTVLPFNSTDIYPSQWSETHGHHLISLLPARKRLNHGQQDSNKKRKRVKNSDIDLELNTEEYEMEQFDLTATRLLPCDYALSDKGVLIKIFFNHKCFTGPSLSKGKICSLPQYVGPGPMRLVMEEVVTKVISVAYVPPRILNDLSSKSFKDLLVARDLTNTSPIEFKAKYQKRVHRELVPVCLNPADVARYCECVCEHLKCCYNLFGPNLYDGDDCPGHCRALTKSNKFMKRATYYREKARLGELVGDNNASKKSNNNGSKTSRARYAGRDSSESTSSTNSRTEQPNSRASSAGCDEAPTNDLKENLASVEEQPNESANEAEVQTSIDSVAKEYVHNNQTEYVPQVEPNHDDGLLMPYNDDMNGILTDMDPSPDFYAVGPPEKWTIDDVAVHLKWNGLGKFVRQMVPEGIDGQALLLLDKAAIKEHFHDQLKFDYKPEDVKLLYRFIQSLRSRTRLMGV